MKSFVCEVMLKMIQRLLQHKAHMRHEHAAYLKKALFTANFVALVQQLLSLKENHSSLPPLLPIATLGNPHSELCGLYSSIEFLPQLLTFAFLMVFCLPSTPLAMIGPRLAMIFITV